MKPQVEVALACLIGLIWIQQCLCDEFSTSSGLNNWTCTCSLSYQGDQTFVKSNCSKSCDCIPEGSSRNTWTCTCAADRFPTITAGSHDSTCFTACNCASGSLSKAQAGRKQFSSEVAGILLLLCAILTTIAFLGCITCYVYRKDKCPFRLSILRSDRETSYSSAVNLIIHKASSVSECRVSANSHLNPGCFQWTSFSYGRSLDILNGTIVRYQYSELEIATQKFSNSNLIGLGRSSCVYRGHLKNGKTVAVKRLKVQEEPDVDSIFLKEVEILSRVHHCHLVPLIGWCSEFHGKHSERLLVFEYMPNGNLRDCLDADSGEIMKWETRTEIALGAAKGLEYLHEASSPRIFHRDVKSTNILLDQNWRPKIADLGMAKLLIADGVSSVSSSPANMQGTFGYIAPEYSMVGKASLMSDVYSFGVVVLELITGRRPIRKSSDKGQESLVLWAMPHLQDSMQVVSELPDPRLKGKFRVDEMRTMADLAKECLLFDPDARPTMSEVVQILSTISPDKSRRKNIPGNLFQTPFAEHMKVESYNKKPDILVEGFVDTEELRSKTSIEISPPSSTPSELDYNLSARQNTRKVATVPSKDMETLILLTSKPQTWRAIDEEAIDLTEPQFESFFMGNNKSP